MDFFDVDMGMCRIYNASITFRDSKGIHWHRSANGNFKCFGKTESYNIRNLELPVSDCIVTRVV